MQLKMMANTFVSPLQAPSFQSRTQGLGQAVFKPAVDVVSFGSQSPSIEEILKKLNETTYMLNSYSRNFEGKLAGTPLENIVGEFDFAKQQKFSEAIKDFDTCWGQFLEYLEKENPPCDILFEKRNTTSQASDYLVSIRNPKTDKPLLLLPFYTLWGNKHLMNAPHQRTHFISRRLPIVGPHLYNDLKELHHSTYFKETDGYSEIYEQQEKLLYEYLNKNGIFKNDVQ